MGVSIIALTVTKPVAAIANFFLAVLMVVVATYLLLYWISYTFKFSRKTLKEILYKPQNFISFL